MVDSDCLLLLTLLRFRDTRGSFFLGFLFDRVVA